MSGSAVRDASRLLAATALALALGGAARAAAATAADDTLAALEGRPIAAIHLEVGDVFDPVPDGALGPFYRLANRLHLRSREATVRAHIVIERGEPFSRRRLEQQERVLRGLDFLQPVGWRAAPAGDSVVVWIRTRDAWTTQPELNLERGGGRQFGTFGISERNLLGLGKTLAVYYSEQPEGISRRIALADPAVLGSRVQFRYGASDGSSGATDQVVLWRPFLIEDDRVSGGVSWVRSGSRARLYEGGGEVASFARDVDDFEAWFGIGKRDEGIVRRITVSYRVLDRRFGASDPVAGAPPEFRGPPLVERFRRLAVEARLWRPHFIERPRPDQPDRIDDVDIGPSVSLMAGVAPASFGSSADEGFVLARADFGGETRLGSGTVRSVVSSRLRRRAVETVRSLDARWLSTWGGRHALVLAAYGAAGSSVPRDFQLVIGGLSGLRAYPVHALSGRELVRFNTEHRVTVARDVARLLTFGIAGFWDAGRAWGPGAVGTVWHHDAGAGIRLSGPSAAYGHVLRFDVAWPVSPTRDGGRAPVFSFGSTQAF